MSKCAQECANFGRLLRGGACYSSAKRAPMASRLRYALLLLPFIAYLDPALYSRAEPRLFGFPFFYWYQLLWVALTSVVLGVVLLLGRLER